MASSKISLHLNMDFFPDLVGKIKDLSKIDKIVKLKIDQDDILTYSMLSNDVSVLALKNYKLETSKYITNFNSEFTFDFIISDSDKIVKNLGFFNSEMKTKIDMVYKESPEDEGIMQVRASQFSNGKLKISVVGGESHKIRDINKNALESRLNPKNSKWGFKISQSDFLDIKKLCSINSEDKIVNINVLDGKVSMSENSKWELDIDDIDYSKNTQLTFNKKYLGNMNSDQESIEFRIFETFILVSDVNSNLMCSFEQDFTNDNDD